MRCAFPACDYDSSQNSAPEISFHRLPEDVSLRAAWLKAFGHADWVPGHGSIVCSKHFLVDNLLVTTKGNQLQTDSGSSVNLRVCRICFATDCKMYSMTSYKVFNDAYESLTGIMTADENHLPRYLCTVCVDRLMNCAQFRRQSLRAHLTLLDIVKRHGRINIDLIRSTIRSNSIHNRNNDHFGFDNEESDEVNKSTGEPSETRLEEANMYENVNSEFDYVIGNSRVNNDDRVNDMINPTVNEVKKENDDFSNQEDFNMNSCNLGEHVVNGLAGAVSSSEVADSYASQDNHSMCLSNLEEDIVVDDIIAQNDMINRDDISACSFSLEEEEDIDVDVVTVDNDVNINQDIVNDEVTSNKTLLYPARLFEDIVSSVLKRQHGLNKCSPKVKSFSDCTEYQNSFLFVGENVMDDFLPIQKVRRRPKKVKKQRNFKKKKVGKAQTMESDVGLSTDNILRCEMCRYKTVNDIELLEHLKTHATNKSYYCDMCDFGTDRKILILHHIRNHMELRNTVKKPQCNICLKILVNKSSLDRHLRVHTGEKPYGCDICDKNFSRKSNLLLHLRIHSGEKPFSCRFCKRKFSRNYNLLEHLEVHSDKKIYTCKYCKESYRCKAALRLHLKRGSCKKNKDKL